MTMSNLLVALKRPRPSPERVYIGRRLDTLPPPYVLDADCYHHNKLLIPSTGAAAAGGVRKNRMHRPQNSFGGGKEKVAGLVPTPASPLSCSATPSESPQSSGNFNPRDAAARCDARPKIYVLLGCACKFQKLAQHLVLHGCSLIARPCGLPAVIECPEKLVHERVVQSKVPVDALVVVVVRPRLDAPQERPLEVEDGEEVAERDGGEREAQLPRVEAAVVQEEAEGAGVEVEDDDVPRGECQRRDRDGEVLHQEVAVVRDVVGPEAVRRADAVVELVDPRIEPRHLMHDEMHCEEPHILKYLHQDKERDAPRPVGERVAQCWSQR
mmetsp:Transcript_4484/g.14374  ORF Transcript_4484/g.14374 Transcript_4484/m.14374 type:complete len:326 (-) Transcript_4484:407-1384(-)